MLRANTGIVDTLPVMCVVTITSAVMTAQEEIPSSPKPVKSLDNDNSDGHDDVLCPFCIPRVAKKDNEGPAIERRRDRKAVRGGRHYSSPRCS